MFSTMTDAMSLEVSYQQVGGFYGDVYKQDKSVLVSTSNQKELPLEIEVVAEEVVDAVVTAKLCFEDETGCMELETKG